DHGLARNGLPRISPVANRSDASPAHRLLPGYRTIRANLLCRGRLVGCDTPPEIDKRIAVCQASDVADLIGEDIGLRAVLPNPFSRHVAQIELELERTGVFPARSIVAVVEHHDVSVRQLLNTVLAMKDVSRVGKRKAATRPAQAPLDR